MAVQTPLINRFNGGEVSPYVEARTDLDWYYSSVRIMENMIGLTEGPATRRPGTRFVCAVKDHTKRVRLINFEASSEQAYVLEQGDGYIRFLKNEGQIAVAATDAAIANGDFTSDITSWTDSSTGGGAISHDATNGRLNLDLSAGTLAAATQSVAGTATGTEHVLVFRVDGAIGDYVHLRIGTSSGGEETLADWKAPVGRHAVAFTPTSNPFYVQFRNADLAKIVQVDDVALLDDQPLELASPYGSAQLAGLKWTQSVDVLYLAHPDKPPAKLEHFGDTTWSLVTIPFIDGPYLDENTGDTTLTPGAASGFAVTITASAVAGINGDKGFQSTDLGRLVRIGHPATSWAASTAYVLGVIRYNLGSVYKCVTAGTSAASGGPSGTGTGIVDGTCQWDFQNLGGNRWGWGRIVEVTNTKSVKLDVAGDFGGTAAVAAWRLGLYSDTTGYPAAVVLHEERVDWVGAKIARPTRFDETKTADFENFTPGTADNDPIAYNIGTNDPIRWAVSQRELLMGSVSTEIRVKGDTDTAALTPTNISAKPMSRYGSADIVPLLVSSAILFVQRQARKLRELVYDLSADSYKAPNLNARARHVTKSGIAETAFQQEPNSIVWVARVDGLLVGLTYERDESVLGWHRHPLGGTDAKAESLAVIPSPTLGSDQLWIATSRTIGGVTKRYIEFLEDPLDDDADQAEAFYVDCGLTYDGAAARTISGLDHLEGETVSILADGAAHADKTVTGGEITLDRDGELVHVGLACPWKLQPMRIEAGSQQGTAQTKTKIIKSLGLDFFRTLGVKVGRDEDNLDTIEFRSGADRMDAPVPLFTGVHEIAFKGKFDKEGLILLTGDQPFPATIRAIVPLTDTREG